MTPHLKLRPRDRSVNLQAAEAFQHLALKAKPQERVWNPEDVESIRGNCAQLLLVTLRAQESEASVRIPRLQQVVLVSIILPNLFKILVMNLSMI